MATAPLRIEELLVGAGIATTDDLERAKRRMSERGGRLLANLAALTRFDDERFARMLAGALGLPLAEAARLKKVAAPRTPSRRAALRALAIERVLLPIGARREPREVEVAMFDPTDGEAVERLRAICGGAAIKITIAPRRALLDAIAQTYGREQSGTLGDHAGAMLIHDDERILGDDEATQLGAAPMVIGAPVPPVRGATGSLPDITPLKSPLSPGSGGGLDSDAFTPPPTLMREVRLGRVLLEAVSLLADLLEERVSQRPREGKELARAVRLVATELGLSPPIVDELGVAAQLHVVERALAEQARARGETPPSLADALGWAAAAPGGIGPILRALGAGTADSQTLTEFPRGARIILTVREYMSLAAAAPDGRPDPETVNQLLRVTTPPEIIEALLRALAALSVEGVKEPGHVG